MSFLEILKTTADETENLLGELLALKNFAAPRIGEAMRYSALGQGKRLRPFFVCESAQMLGAERQNALRVGAALECIHCYSLVHDDLPAMDDDDLRRGKPTSHIAFDEATAILAGDGLLTYAFEIIADEQTHGDPAVRSQLVLALAKASGHNGMVGGQMLDLEAEKHTGQSLEEIIKIQNLKTGALFHFSLVSGAILAGGTPEQFAALATYAQKVGLAFQIADDVLDVESSPEQLGKATQKDAEAGKSTFIDLYGLAGAKQRAALLSDEACEALSLFGEKAENLYAAARFIVDRKK
ncbi:(2E,6E)-farnesyl diphosphate synthase [hydrothermal vent metagenome]|uniref:(2E,6E)-farnesyl diphosphate synthase n=1 Tax=hydrothermal vent metagenome TaxID=652676 RepID=A0A3B0RHD2_9ZZZZ